MNVDVYDRRVYLGFAVSLSFFFSFRTVQTLSIKTFIHAASRMTSCGGQMVTLVACGVNLVELEDSGESLRTCNFSAS